MPNPSVTTLFCTVNTHIKATEVAPGLLQDACAQTLALLLEPQVAGQLVHQRNGGHVVRSTIEGIAYEVAPTTKQFHVHFTWNIYSTEHNVVGRCRHHACHPRSLVHRFQYWWRDHFRFRPRENGLPYFHYIMLTRTSGARTYQFRKQFAAPSGDRLLVERQR